LNTVVGCQKITSFPLFCHFSPACSKRPPQSELEDYCEQLKAEFEARPAKSINEAVQRIEELTGIRRSPTQVEQFLNVLSYRNYACHCGPGTFRGD